MGNRAECGATRIGSECVGKAQDIATMPKARQLADQRAMQCKLKDAYLISTAHVCRAHSSSPGMSLQGSSDKPFSRSARDVSAVGVSTVSPVRIAFTACSFS